MKLSLCSQQSKSASGQVPMLCQHHLQGSSKFGWTGWTLELLGGNAVLECNSQAYPAKSSPGFGGLMVPSAM